MALKTIMYCSNKYRKDALKGPYTVYRGFCLLPDQLEDYRQIVQEEGKINLMGFTSTLMNRKQAEAFALQGCTSKKLCPVLARITINTSYKYFQLDQPEYSAYHDQYQEILLQDGIALQLQSIEKQTYDPSYLNKLPYMQEQGLLFTDSVKFTVINMVQKNE